ncbi:hypothetical protein ABDB91_11125 [Desulfoscipio sp. XC116]|uniref:hypothetical protein n=1 Tax=Desulfoscipio sp. XC116 TaxID=3144975 RepID=UPI00325BF540
MKNFQIHSYRTIEMIEIEPEIKKIPCPFGFPDYKRGVSVNVSSWARKVVVFIRQRSIKVLVLKMLKGWNKIMFCCWAVYSFMPWLIRDLEEMSYEQLKVTERHLAGDGIALATDRNEYAPGDTVLLTMANHTEIELGYPLEGSPGGLYSLIAALESEAVFGGYRKELGAFSIAPGDSKTVALKIPETADSGQYAVRTSYSLYDWGPGGHDLKISAPEKRIKVLGPPPPPVPREGTVEMIDEHKAEVYLGEKTYVEAVMGNAPLELHFHLPEGVGYARVAGSSLNSYEKHAEYLYFKMQDGQPVSGSNVTPKSPAKVSFEMDIDRDDAGSHGLLMRYQEWVADKKPMLFKIVIEMDVVY